MTSDAQARPQEEDAVTAASSPAETPSPDAGASAGSPEGETTEKDRAPRRRATRGNGDDGEGGAPTTTRPSLPLVPVLAVLLVLLLAGVGFLWFTRPGKSSVRTDDYVDVLQAARSEVVDMTSFDYLTLDDDLVPSRIFS